jgi:hypothetical protein
MDILVSSSVGFEDARVRDNIDMGCGSARKLISSGDPLKVSYEISSQSI